MKTSAINPKSASLQSAIKVLKVMSTSSYNTVVHNSCIGICRNLPLALHIYDTPDEDTIKEVLYDAFKTWPQYSGSLFHPVFDTTDQLYVSPSNQYYEYRNLWAQDSIRLSLRQSLAAHCAKYFATYDYVQFLQRMIDVHIPAYQRSEKFLGYADRSKVIAYLCEVLRIEAIKSEHPANIARLQKLINTKMGKVGKDTLSSIIGYDTEPRIKWLQHLIKINSRNLTTTSESNKEV